MGQFDLLLVIYEGADIFREDQFDMHELFYCMYKDSVIETHNQIFNYWQFHIKFLRFLMWLRRQIDDRLVQINSEGRFDFKKQI